MIKSGIYKITNIFTNKIYIGSSVNVITRIKHHENCLKANKHINKHLQNSYNLYGKNSLHYECIEIVEDATELSDREQYWIDNYKSFDQNIGYNICKNAGNTIGLKKTEEQKFKTSSFKNKNSKISKEIAKKIIEEYLTGNKTQRELCQIFNLSICIISKFLNGKTYKDFYNFLSEEEKTKIKFLNKSYKQSTRLVKKSIKRKKVSDETREKHRIKGKKIHENNPDYFKNLFKGKKHTKETKDLISKKKKGVKISVERIEKIKNMNRDYMTGEKNCNSVLNYEKAREIRKLRLIEKITIKKLAIIFGVSEPTIKRVLYNKTYKENNDGAEKKNSDN